jgi:hypothetical protein
MQTYLYMLDTDWVVEIDYRVTSYGCEAQTYGPPESCYPSEGPEWEVRSITLRRDEGANVVTPEWEATGKMFELLCERFDQEIADMIYEDGWDYGPDPDDYREREWDRQHNAAE